MDAADFLSDEHLQESLINDPRFRSQYDRIAAHCRRALDDGSFSYTRVLLAPEPIKTLCLSYLDGVSINGGIPHYDGVVENWDGKGLLLVHIDADKTIKHPVKHQVVLPGSGKVRTEESLKDFGNAAVVPDLWPDRIARNVLYQQGWPIRQRGDGECVGGVVEWRWLRQAACASRPQLGVPELYREITSRQSFLEVAAAAGELPPDLTPSNTTAKRSGKGA